MVDQTQRYTGPGPWVVTWRDETVFAAPTELACITWLTTQWPRATVLNYVGRGYQVVSPAYQEAHR